MTAVRVRFARVVPPGESRTIRFVLRAPRPRLARAVAVGKEGAFASWYGNWYPWLAASPCRARVPRAATEAPGATQ